MVAVDLCWSTSGDRVDRISPQLQCGAPLGIILVAIVNTVGDAAFALPAVVQDPLADDGALAMAEWILKAQG